MHKIIELLSIAISIVIAERVEQQAEKLLLNDTFSLLLSLAIITLGKELLPVIFLFIIENTFLKRIILNRHYIDGTWLDAMIKDNVIVDVGKSQIDVDEDGICYSGYDFSANRNAQGYYSANLSELKWPVLSYTFSYHVSAQTSLIQGMGELIFIARNGIPFQYMGYYVNVSSGEKIEFEGWRVTDKKILKELDNPLLRQNAIRNFFESHPSARFAPIV